MFDFKMKKLSMLNKKRNFFQYMSQYTPGMAISFLTKGMSRASALAFHSEQ